MPVAKVGRTFATRHPTTTASIHHITPEPEGRAVQAGQLPAERAAPEVRVEQEELRVLLGRPGQAAQLELQRERQVQVERAGRGEQPPEAQVALQVPTAPQLLRSEPEERGLAAWQRHRWGPPPCGRSPCARSARGRWARRIRRARPSGGACPYRHSPTQWHNACRSVGVQSRPFQLLTRISLPSGDPMRGRPYSPTAWVSAV